MGSRQDHGRVETDKFCDLRLERPDDGTRHGQFTEQVLRKAQCTDQVHIPGLLPGIDKSGGRSVRVFLLHHSGEQIVQIIRDHQKAPRLLQRLRLLLLQGDQLIDRIEADLLDPGPLVEFFLRDEHLCFFGDPVCPAVPVGNRIGQHLFVLIQQHIVHAPGIDRDGGWDLSKFPAVLQSLQDSLSDVVHVPADMAVSHDLAVVKPSDLFQDHLPILQMSQDVAPAGRSDVNGKIIVLHVSALLCSVSFSSY